MHHIIKKSIFLLFSPFLFSYSSTTPQNGAPEYIQYYNEGVVAQQNRDYAAAIEHYKEALEIKDDFSDAWNNLGYCYRMIAKTYLTQSGEAYNKALQHDPEHERALEYQGEYYLMLGHLDKSYKNYQLLQKMKSPEAKELKEAIDPLLKEARTILKTYSP